MANDCLPDYMYESVDYQQSRTPQTPAARPSNKYEVLSNVTQNQSNYQQLNIEDGSANSLAQLKQIKRESRCAKVVASLGLMIAAFFVFLTTAAISLAVRPVSNVSAKMGNNLTSVNNSNIPLSVFQNCSQERKTCPIMHLQDSRITCNTATLLIKKEVS